MLVRMRLTTSKRKLDIYYSKLGIRVASGFVEQLKTLDLRKLGNFRKKIKFRWARSVVRSLPSRF